MILLVTRLFGIQLALRTKLVSSRLLVCQNGQAYGGQLIEQGLMDSSLRQHCITFY